MPPFEAFRDAESYYATLAHELTHWTKHPQRLDRDFGRKSWGDEGYSREELVAELGSAFLCADLELHQEPREDNAAYIATWLEVLKNDNRAIFAAAAHAQRAADYLNQKAAAQVLRDLRGLSHRAPVTQTKKRLQTHGNYLSCSAQGPSQAANTGNSSPKRTYP
jgi:antirestriction protein ArdC